MFFTHKEFYLRYLALSTALLFSLPSNAKDIVVMQVGAISGSKATVGLARKVGTEIAFAHANANGGIAGNKIKYVVFDDEYKAKKTIEILNREIPKEKPVLLTGLRGTGPVKEVIKQGILEREKIPLVGVYTGADEIRNPTNPYAFHVRSSYGQEIDKIVRHYTTIGIKKLAFVSENNAFGKAVTEAFNAAVKRYNADVVAHAVVEINAKEFGAMYSTLEKAKPSGVVLGTSGSTSDKVIKALRDKDWMVPMTMLSINDVEDIIQLVGVEKSRGLAQVQIAPDPDNCKLKLCRELEDDYKKYSGKSDTPSPTTMEGYIIGRTIVAALQKAGRNPDRASILRALNNNMKNIDLGGYVISFSPTQHNGTAYTDIGVLNKNGVMLY